MTVRPFIRRRELPMVGARMGQKGFAPAATSCRESGHPHFIYSIT